MKFQEIKTTAGTKAEIVSHYNYLVRKHNTHMDSIMEVAKRAMEEKCDEAEEYVKELFNALDIPFHQPTKVTMTIDLPFGDVEKISDICDEDGNTFDFYNIEKVE